MEIKSKIEARQEALSLAIMSHQKMEFNEQKVIQLAKLFEDYLIGDAELPEKPLDFGQKMMECVDKINGAIDMKERYGLGLMGHVPDIQS